MDTSSKVDEKKPVVLLLGWAGAKERNLMKYAQIYNDAGWVSVWMSYILLDTVSSTSSRCATIPVFRILVSASICLPSFELSMRSQVISGVTVRGGWRVDCGWYAHTVRSLFIHSQWMVSVHLYHSGSGLKSNKCSIWGIESKQSSSTGTLTPFYHHPLSAPSIPRGSRDARAVVSSTPPLEGFGFISDSVRVSLLHQRFNIRNALVCIVSILHILPSDSNIRHTLSSPSAVPHHILLPTGPNATTEEAVVHLFDQWWYDAREVRKGTNGMKGTYSDTLIDSLTRWRKGDVRWVCKKDAGKQYSQTEVLRYEDSRHVGHMQAHAREYTEACRRIVDEVGLWEDVNEWILQVYKKE